MQRRTTAVLLLLAAALVLALWLQRDGPTADDALTVEADPEAAREGAMLRAEREVAGIADAPTLRGRAETSDDARRGDVLVRVVGPAGDPIPGVFVSVRANEEQRGDALPIDDRGEVVLRDLPWDGSHRVHFWARDPDDGRGGRTWEKLDARAGDGPAWRAVDGPTLTYMAATGLWMHADVVDASTGAPVRGARVQCFRARIDPKRWFDAPARFFITPEIGRDWVHSVRVEAPKGWVAWDPAWVTATISPYAERASFTYPLRREVETTLVPVDEAGNAVAADVTRVEFARTNLEGWSADGDAYGRLHLRGVPWLPGEQVRIRVMRRDREGYTWVDAPIPDHPGGRIELQVDLPADGILPLEDHNEAIGMGGSGRGWSRIRTSTRYANALIVTVLRRDGSPARGCRVSCARGTETTDALGRVRFESLPPGAYTLTVEQAGILPLSGTVTVAAEGTWRLTLRERAGGTVEVVVVDTAGRPLPYARLAVATPSGLPWLDVAGVVQRLDPFTDHLGRRVLRHVETGAITVTARWGSRTAKASVEVGEAKETSLRIELPDAR